MKTTCLLVALLLLLPIHADTGFHPTTDFSALPSEYCIRMELSSLDSTTEAEIAEELSSAVSKALSAASSRLKEADFDDEFKQGRSGHDVRVEIIRHFTRGNLTVYYFSAFQNGKPVSGNISGTDINLLSGSYASAMLQCPLYRSTPKLAVDQDRPSPWWIIALVIGSGVLILCLGWCLLFLYLNICAPDRAAYEVSKIVYQTDDSTQCDLPPPQYQQKENSYRNHEDYSKKIGKKRKEEIRAISPVSPVSSPDISPPVKSDFGRKTMYEYEAPVAKEDNNVAVSKETVEEDIVEKPHPVVEYPEDDIYYRTMKRDHQPEVTRGTSRPKAASRSRKIREYNDKEIYKLDTTIWRNNDVGGIVSTTCATGVSVGHPRPRSPVENGVLQPPLLLAADNTLPML